MDNGIKYLSKIVSELKDMNKELSGIRSELHQMNMTRETVNINAEQISRKAVEVLESYRKEPK